MTEPDEALLWAREQCATDCDERGFSHVAERYRRGAYDNLFEGDAHAYRAGAAASAGRIKALEAALDQICDLLSDAMQADCENGVQSLNEAAAANYLNDFPHTKKALDAVQAVCLSMLKEPDQ